MTKETANIDKDQTVDESKTASKAKVEAKVSTDAKRKAAKATKKARTTTKAKKGATTMKKTASTPKKKSMKAKVPVDNTKDIKAVRALCNKVLTSKAEIKAGLTLVENAHGAIQVKREDGLMFSFRKTGRGCIITHPITTGKDKARWNKHSGNKWDHLTDCRWNEATEKMLLARIKDTKSAKNYHDEIYKGKKVSNSGLILKAESAKTRLAKLANEAKKSTGKKKREASKSKKASNVVKRQASKKSKKSAKVKVPPTPAVSAVANSVA